MKKLFRSEKPSCLEKYQHGLNNWGEVTPDDKRSIWLQFDLMQMGFCAYCECTLTEKHIEHFKDKDSYPKDTFNWSNLFGSCDYKNRCGHHKDSRKVKPYLISNILKPDEDDINDYFVYLTNGSIAIKSGLTRSQELKARETIRVFNLNDDKSLVNRRKTSFRNIKENINVLYGMLDLEQDDWNAILESEIDDLKKNKVEFQTAMEHAWRYNRQFL